MDMSPATTSPTETTARRARAVSIPDGTDANSSDPGSGLKRAIIYLRVSSAGQVNTDYDPEGLSIPAQRSSCLRKIDQMADTVLAGEYVEPGVTGTVMDKRPAFQEMLARIREQRDIDYVVVYKLSRMNRNRVDDALVLMQLRQHGVTLISATEMIDDTPEGQLMHGMLATFNEFRSAADGADIRYKMAEKAKRGGTLGRAPLGYLNTREHFEGREVRTVAPDADRGPLITVAFELYATGEYTLDALSEELAHRGLLTRPTRRNPAQPLSISQLSRLLRDTYYLGLVTYQGNTYPGRHPALITQDLYDTVQDVLASRRRTDERRRVHNHFLKGSLWCGACHAAGRESRMLIQKATGRGGTYFYWFCRARQDHTCTTRHVRFEDVEDAVADHYRTIRFNPDLADAIRAEVTAVLTDHQSTTRLLHQQTTTHLARLDRQEENLLDLAADGDMPKTKVKERLRRIASERAQLEQRLATTDTDLAAGAARLEDALQLLEHPDQLYQQLTPDQRRTLTQAIFTKLYIHHDQITDDQITPHLQGLVELTRTVDHDAPSELTDPQHAPTSRGRRQITCHRPLRSPDAQLLAAALASEGSSSSHLVGAEGLEPPTSAL